MGPIVEEWEERRTAGAMLLLRLVEALAPPLKLASALELFLRLVRMRNESDGSREIVGADAIAPVR